ncbi:MAG TPA: hypothetical protein VK465_10510, partial [Fibrobacteria bacterium]|nr:hypothetical protein [Fibrobacteria bacterium]
MNFDPFDPFAKKNNPEKSWDEVFKKSSGRSGGKRKAETEASDEMEPDAKFQKLEEVQEPPPPAQEAVTLSNPLWVEREGFFNEKGMATVEGTLPPSISHLTRVTFTLFASSSDGMQERIDAKEGHLADGKASVAFDLFYPSFREPSGDLVKQCDYHFKAKHVRSAEVQSAALPVRAPVQVKLELTGLTPLFAPSAENCVAKYKVKDGKLKPGAKATLIVMDASGKALFTKADLEITQADEGSFEWDGKGSDGKYAQPTQSPLKATVEVTGDARSRSDAKEARIEFKEIRIAIAGMDGNKRVVVNVPNADVEATASFYLKKSDGTGVLTEVPIRAEFSFEDPSNNNVEKNASYEYSPGSKLGKRGDAAAMFWKAAGGFTTTSADAYKTTCVVEAKTAAGPEQGVAKALFKPSGVGGDDYILAVKVFAADGTTELAKGTSDTFTVWRKILFTQVYTMDGEAYLDTATTHAEIGPAFETTGANGAFVLYERGAVT